MPGVGDMERCTEVRVRNVVARFGAVEKAEPKYDAAAARSCEASCLGLGRERRSQEIGCFLNRRGLVDEALGWVNECNGWLHEDCGSSGERSINEQSRRLPSEAVVLSPRLWVGNPCGRWNSCRKVQNRVGPVHRRRNCDRIEEIQLRAQGSHHVVPVCLEEWNGSPAEHAAPTGEEDSHAYDSDFRS